MIRNSRLTNRYGPGGKAGLVSGIAKAFARTSVSFMRLSCSEDARSRLEEPKPKPAKMRAVLYEAAIDQFVQTQAVISFGPNPTSGQYSQGPGTQRKTSPSTATWQTDGNDR